MANNTLLGNVWEYEKPPSFHPFFFFEDMNYAQWRHFMAINWKLPFYVSAIYLVVIFSIQHFMKKRKAFKLQGPLVLWNLGLGIFSILGFLRIAPELLMILKSPQGFHKSVCIREGLNAPAASFALLFALSKYVELGDTIFIVLRKQELIFLQWYHHCTALILAWQVLPYAEPIHRFYGVMNYAVHGLMYPYFALKAMKVYIPRRFSMMITILQLLQMIVGVGVNFYSVYVMYILKLPCARDSMTIKWIAIIYGSFVILFGDFLYKSYFSKSKRN